MEIFYKDKIKILAFDVDGTLFSSENIILDAYIESIQNFILQSGKVITIPTKERIIEQVGLPVKQIFGNLLPDLLEKDRNLISDNVLVLLCEKIYKKKGMLYDNVQATIQELYNRNYVICVASNGRAPYINAILDAYDLTQYFQSLFVINYKDLQSKGDILKAYLKRFEQLGHSALMIGDRKSDSDAAIEANSPFAFCEYGHADQGEIETYSIKLKAIQELLDFL